MSSIAIEKRTGGKKTIGSEAVQALGQAMRGQLLLPGQEGYDSARIIWNAMIDKRPAVVARCAGVADIMRCVAFTREHDLLRAAPGARSATSITKPRPLVWPLPWGSTPPPAWRASPSAVALAGSAANTA